MNGNDNLSNEEVAFLEMHITQKKRELVNKTFKEEHPRGKICNKTKRGYLKPTGINIFATTEEELYEKLYNFYFPSYATLNDIYVSWIHKRLEKNKTIGKPSAKTITQAKKYFGDSVDFYVNEGSLESTPSTLIEIEDGKMKILRQGEKRL